MNTGQAVNSVLSLHQILIDKIVFERNDDCSKLPDNMSFEFNSKLCYADDKENYRLIVDVALGNGADKDIFMNVVMSGFFSFDTDSELDQTYKEKLIQENTLAIMFPYIRSVITTITSQTGIQPVILPLINIVGLLEQQKMKEESENQ